MKWQKGDITSNRELVLDTHDDEIASVLLPSGEVEVRQCSRCGHCDAYSDCCPYSLEINDDSTPCVCCDSCRQECAMDV